MKFYSTVYSASFLHKIGNMISGLCQVIDGIILIVSLGNVVPCFTFHWVFKRLGTVFYQSKNKIQNETT